MPEPLRRNKLYLPPPTAAVGRPTLVPRPALYARLDQSQQAGYKLALVSAARGDLWISAAPKNEWDVCAGHLLVREAGGVFVTLDDGERRYNQSDTLLLPEMAAGPAALVEGFIERRQAA